MSTQTDNGRAFEWTIGQALQLHSNFPLQANAFSEHAKQAFNKISQKKQMTFQTAANVAVKHLLDKEKYLVSTNAEGSISFNTDTSGISGDVRDVFMTSASKNIGISCKNNHEALKHSRLSKNLDFVKKWGIDSNGCDQTYWASIHPIFDELAQIKHNSNGQCLWRDIDQKAEKYYWPLLDSWAKELQRIAAISPEKEAQLCQAIITYLVGVNDFYKVICEGTKRVHIQAWNFNNSLATKRTKYPTSLIAINNKNGGQFSKTLVFNHGYSINFRIHSASSRVEPSLKFDIKAIGLPSSEIYQQTLDF